LRVGGVNLTALLNVNVQEAVNIFRSDLCPLETLMKKWLSGTIALLGVVWAFGVLALAQDLTGTWQGTLQISGKELRTVIRITKEDATLRAILYSIDQGGQGLAGTAALDGSNVRMSFPGANIRYEGRLGTDGNSITGTASQGAGNNPLTLARVTAEAAWPIPAAPAALKPMPADANPGFEVATIKPTRPDTQGRLYGMKGRQFMTINTSVANLITFAYGMHSRQIVNGAPWTNDDHFDIMGTPDVEGAPSARHMRSMVQKLLADRFKLTFHYEKQELPVYALTVARNGPKLTKSAGDPNGLPSLLFRGLGLLPAQNASMTDFANVMQSAVLDRPVVDRTGLAGKYDFVLNWTPDDSQVRSMGAVVPPPPDNAKVPGLFTAIEEQLGLRFESTRAPVQVLVIDRVEKPTPD
jgi:uncharacterized protein (TIGR03435 family)